MEMNKILGLSPVIPVVKFSNLEHCSPLGEALLSSGIKIIEVTLRSDIALQHIAAMTHTTDCLTDLLNSMRTFVRHNDSHITSRLKVFSACFDAAVGMQDGHTELHPLFFREVKLLQQQFRCEHLVLDFLGTRWFLIAHLNPP